MTCRILIADDHKLIRRGVTLLIAEDPDFEVVGEATNTDETIRLATELKPDILLLDISMPGAGGIEATRQLVRLRPDLRILILTVHEDSGMLTGAMRAGAVGYIVKRAADTELMGALRALAAGDVYVHPAMTRALLQELARPEHAKSDAADALTPRSKEVLRLLARGCTNRQIAQELNISVRTVEGHRANIQAKLGLKSRVDLVNYATMHHLLD
ncbi:MAG: response regulator transcription factor [Anaerolineales bacterium]|nr:response regulator transcription factor [Anaerolineales bacterium]